MLGHWANLLNTDCIVVDIGPHTVYPIFRVGSSSLMSVADKLYTKKQIHIFEHINFMILEPGHVLVPGQNLYCQQHTLSFNGTWCLVFQGQLANRHFAHRF